ncbi:MAG: heme-binding protein [Pyrinomonadaceae bacterium]
MSNKKFFQISVTAAFALISGHAFAACAVNFAQLKAALDAAVAAESSGLDNPSWATVVDRTGRVCAVAVSGSDPSAAWPGSRVISAQKANTGNAFSTNELSLSSANLYASTQPGGDLSSLLASNLVDATIAYDGVATTAGTENDPLVGKRIGGLITFGGGLALYGANGIVGGLGSSGDTSCADHNIAWRIRAILNLDHVPAGVNADLQRPDNIIFDIIPNPSGGIGISPSNFGHPTCLNTSGSDALPPVGQ